MAKKNGLSQKELVLMCLLGEEPSHAYGLEVKIRERRMDEWTEIGFSSIYRVLSGLEKKGLVEAQLEHNGPGATRKVYRHASKGQAALVSGLLERIEEVHPIKNPFQVSLAYLTMLPRDEIVEKLKTRSQAVQGAINEVSQCSQGLVGCDYRLKGSMNGLAGSDGSDGSDGSKQARTEHLKILFEHLYTHLEAEQEFLRVTLAYLDSSEGRTLFKGRDESKDGG